MCNALILSFLFFIGSMFGWVLELLFRRIAHGKWINPGFLTGPALPLYGTGLCFLYILSNIPLTSIEDPILQNIARILLMTVVMTAIEYIAGLLFIKGMNIKLWDYSKRWGNIDGIICPLFSVIWGAVGAAYYYLVHPHILQSLLWLSNNLAFSYFIGYFFGIFTLDLAHSLNITVKLRRFAKENRLVLRYEELKLHIREEQEKRHEKIHYVFPFRTEELSKTLERYRDKLKALTQKEEKEEKGTPPEGQTPPVLDDNNKRA